MDQRQIVNAIVGHDDLLKDLKFRVEVLERKVADQTAKAVRKKKPEERQELEVDFERLDEASESELVAICRLLGVPEASRQLSRDDLMGIITGDVTVVHDPLREIRDGTYAYLQKNHVMTSNMPCDRECLKCPHDAVVACHTANLEL